MPFLADLVTLTDPTNRWSFLNYLRAHNRLYHFYFFERFHVPRQEYDHYCRWVADRLPSCRFSRQVDAIASCQEEECFVLQVTDPATDRREQHAARNVVLGVGTVPAVPGSLRDILGEDVFHSGEFLYRRQQCAVARKITVVGGGQSGAEVFLELLRDQPLHGYRLSWLTRSAGFFPMEYSKLGLEHFTPDYIRYFHGLPEHVRDRVLPSQNLLYKGISMGTIAEIYDLLYERTVGGATADVYLLAHTEVEEAERTADGLRLHCRHHEQGATFTLDTDCLILASGYTAKVPHCLAPLADLTVWDAAGRYRVGLDYRIEMRPWVTGSLFVQNGELHTHGVGAPDLGLGAHRSAIIVNAVTGREIYQVPERVAFTQFGVTCS